MHVLDDWTSPFGGPSLSNALSVFFFVLIIDFNCRLMHRSFVGELRFSNERFFSPWTFIY